MEISLKESDFLGSFDLLWSKDLDKYKKNKLNLFVLKINSNEFDYDLLIDMLLDPVIDYSISRQVKERYKNRPATLSKKAREKFVEYARNNGELGELLLFCFLETHLGAPKILTKLELKTSTSHYVNGADGVHFLKLPDGNYQLIFGESKTYQDIDGAIRDAFKSIYNFKNQYEAKAMKHLILQCFMASLFLICYWFSVKNIILIGLRCPLIGLWSYGYILCYQHLLTYVPSAYQYISCYLLHYQDWFQKCALLHVGFYHQHLFYA